MITIPDAGRRYVSVMIVKQDHYVNRILHEPGEHDLTVEEFGTPYVTVAARVLADPADPGDIAAANAPRRNPQPQLDLPRYHASS